MITASHLARMAFCALLTFGSTRAAINVSGSSVTEILSATDLNPAAVYEIGYFASEAVPATEVEWANFTPLGLISPKTMGRVDQSGQATPLPGQFAFAETISTRAQLNLPNPADFPRRLGIRFLSADGSETNLVSAVNSDWLLRDPENFASFGADLNLADPDLSWREGSGSAFRILPAAATPDPVIVSVIHAPESFAITVEGLSASTSYQLIRGTDLTTFPDTVGFPFTGATEHVFEDPAPPAGRAFYRVVEQSDD